MSFLNILKRKNTRNIVAPCDGQCYSITLVDDDVFSKKIMGDGIAFSTKSNRIVAPIDGEIKSVFPGGHAYNITNDKGLSLVIHIGLDTVTLKGDGFDVQVLENQRVKKGDLLCLIDLEKLKKIDEKLPIMLVNVNKDMDIDFISDYGECVEGNTVVANY